MQIFDNKHLQDEYIYKIKITFKNVRKKKKM